MKWYGEDFRNVATLEPMIRGACNVLTRRPVFAASQSIEGMGQPTPGDRLFNPQGMQNELNLAPAKLLVIAARTATSAVNPRLPEALLQPATLPGWAWHGGGKLGSALLGGRGGALTSEAAL